MDHLISRDLILNKIKELREEELTEKSILNRLSRCLIYRWDAFLDDDSEDSI